MTDPITTPAQMREAAARLADKTHRAYIAAKGRNPDDYVSEYSKVAAAIRALPVAEPEPLAVKIKPLSDEDRDWIDARADELFRANERARGGVRIQTITPQDFRDYFVVTATRERILSQIVAERTVDASETPVCDHQPDLLSESERQAIRDQALEDAAQCCADEADRCDDAVKWGGHRLYIQACKAAAYAMRDRAYAIRAMKGTKG